MVALRCLPVGTVPAQRARPTWLQDRLRNGLYTMGDINPKGVAGGHVLSDHDDHVDVDDIHDVDIHDVDHDEADDDVHLDDEHDVHAPRRCPEHGPEHAASAAHGCGPSAVVRGGGLTAGCRWRSGTRWLSCQWGTVWR